MAYKSMIAQCYRDFCERLWSDWRDNVIQLPPLLAARFQLDHIPEPYLRFGEGANPLFVLLTNPGKGEHQDQERSTVNAGMSCISNCNSYYEASAVLAEYYQHGLRGASATRIRKMFQLRDLVGADCIVQLESIPFHSASLPRKADIPALISSTPILSEYESSLTDAVKFESVVVLSAVDTSRSISDDTIDHPWLKWQATMLRANRLQRKDLVTKQTKITCAAFFDHNSERTSCFVLTMGGNNFPRDEKLKSVAEILSGTAVI